GAGPLDGGRGRGIRTPDPLLPKQMRYQTAPCPDKSPPPRPENGTWMLGVEPRKRQTPLRGPGTRSTPSRSALPQGRKRADSYASTAPPAPRFGMPALRPPERPC